MTAELQTYHANDDQWYWRLVDGNNRIVATGHEGYTTEAHVWRAIENVKSEMGLLAYPDSHYIVFGRSSLTSLIEDIVAGTVSPDDLWHHGVTR
jgi:uncharacterized protein YegP (UPF0339 family)